MPAVDAGQALLERDAALALIDRRLREATAGPLRQTAEARKEATRNPAVGCGALCKSGAVHEKRLDRLEVIEQWLAEKRA